MKRGQIYTADLSGCIGREQSGFRPVLIVQNDIGNKHGSTVIAVPLTKANKRPLPTHAVVKGDTALCEQVRCLDKSRLDELVAIAEPWELEAVDAALAVALGLK